MGELRRIRCACGHEIIEHFATHKNTSPARLRHQEDLELIPCLRCQRYYVTELALAWRDKLGLPPIEGGSLNQQRWAETIRYKWRYAVEEMKEWLVSLPERDIWVEAVITHWLHHKHVFWWVDRRYPEAWKLYLAAEFKRAGRALPEALQLDIDAYVHEDNDQLDEEGFEQDLGRL